MSKHTARGILAALVVALIIVALGGFGAASIICAILLGWALGIAIVAAIGYLIIEATS